MDYVKALVIKLVMITAVLWIVLGAFYGVSVGDILLTSVLLTGVSFLGDVFILPIFGNASAALGDFGLLFAGVWILGIFLFEGNFSLGSAALISAAIIAVGEYFLHNYMENHDLKDQTEVMDTMGVSPQDKMQTEFGSDVDPEADIKRETSDKGNNEKE
ncbi:YndM family protein [Virgibacillus ihumii]|uniref:YndM family protein n=1 Tax=Virgibacillus ihumii TaxID=2686091 RepID=UPI00157BB9CF|nr:YndM family protein [Virgibacillus ihumii]